MSTGILALPPFDDLEESLDQSIRIPPLLQPLSVVAVTKPQPLEPLTRISNGEIPATKLAIPRKLKKPLPTVNTPTKDSQTLQIHTSPNQTKEGSRKRQKLDFFQLPNPASASTVSSGAASTFPTIPLLSDLRQPPPGAARFPPITPEKPSTQVPSLVKRSKLATNNKVRSTTATKDPKTKRQYLRGRRPWTEQETNDLLKGIEVYGVGKWKSILKNVDYHFHCERSAVDLKDRYRTHQLAQTRPKKAAVSETKQIIGMREQVSSEKVSSPKSDERASPSIKVNFRVNTVKDVRERLARSADSGTNDKATRFVRWTTEEDSKLIQANHKHGFKWTTIAQDPELGLMHRTAGQIRDRFRIKFPQNYESNTPLRTIEASSDLNGMSSEIKGSEGNQKTKNKGNLDWLLHDDSMEDFNASFARLSKDFASQLPNTDEARSGLIGSAKSNTLAGISIPPNSRDHVVNSDFNADTFASNDLSGTMDLSIEADDTRNPNIEELLNDDIEPLSQLPPLKFPFDQDWSGDAYDDSLTLAPLLWGGYDFTTGQWVGGMNG